MKASSKSRLGFTLIELLVTIAMVAILASLVLGAVAKAKSKALTAKCKSNLRQVHLAMAMYVSDQEMYPRGWWNGFPAPGESMNMRGVINRYWWGNLFE